MKIADLEVHLISDGVAHVDAGGPFGLVPRVLYENYFQPDENNRVPQSLTSMLVRSEGKLILIDSGLGDRLTEKEASLWGIDRSSGDLIEGLDRIDVGPADIDFVINTHLHWDHCGGNTAALEDGVAPRFPNAIYFVQHLEWQDASHPDERTRGTYFADNFAPLLKSGRMVLLRGEEQITKHVRCVPTPGHTRGHQSVLLGAQDWKALFVADMAGYAVHMERLAWVTAYDVLPLMNIETKKRWQEWGRNSGAWLIFEHDPFHPVGQFVEREGRSVLQAPGGAQELTAAIPILQPPHG